MARVAFTANLERHLSCPVRTVPGNTVRAVLDGVFAAQPRLRSYILDDQDRVRRHVAIYINGERIADRDAPCRSGRRGGRGVRVPGIVGRMNGRCGMSDRLLVGTKKGLFELRRTHGTWSIASTRFLGDPISMLLHDPRDGALYAAEALGHFGVKLQRSRDGGESWQEIAAPAFPKTGTDGTRACRTCSAWKPAAPTSPAGCGAARFPGALFLSQDHGESWTLNQALWDLPQRKDWMGGGFDDAGVASICVDPRGRST